jgi:BNR/Asp-box repeat protein
LNAKRFSLLVLLAAVAGLAVAAGVAVADDGDQIQPIDFTHNFSDAPAPVPSAQWGNGPKVKTGTAICTTAASTAANVNTDCEFNGPHNETAIAVNPTDPSNIIGGANDYQLTLNPGGHVGEQVASRAHVSFDGGKTWSEYPIYSNSAYQGTGDPSLAFDADGRAYYATLGFRFVGPVNATNPDVLVGTSTDKGKTWAMQRVASGSGTESSVGDLLDKEWVAAWGHGNAIVTFGDFRLGQKGATLNGDIYDVVTHDGGRTWSQPTRVSTLGQAFGSVPTVAGNRIFVAFLDTTHLSDPTAPDYGRDDYMVQEVDPQTGAPLPGKLHDVGLVYDGNYDFPWQLGRPTYQDSAFRTWAFGNITADPNHPDHLAVTWSDMRNSATPYLPFPKSSYGVTTNSDVVVSESTDGGDSWSTPKAIELDGDQFMPWGVFDKDGKLRVGYFDRSVDSANHLYGYSVATETAPGTFTPRLVSTTTSDPTKNDHWFARTIDPAFPRATAFLGDYSNIAALPSGGVAAYWTDMRDENCWPAGPGCGQHGQDAYFGVAP